MNQTISASRRVAMYVTPVVLLSVCLNIPKFMENQVQESKEGNSTEINVSDIRMDRSYMLYYTISQIFHPTLTTGIIPMGILIFMNLAIYKGTLISLKMRASHSITFIQKSLRLVLFDWEIAILFWLLHFDHILEKRLRHKSF